jgi:hypothetical protein
VSVQPGGLSSGWHNLLTLFWQWVKGLEFVSLQESLVSLTKQYNSYTQTV